MFMFVAFVVMTCVVFVVMGCIPCVFCLWCTSYYHSHHNMMTYSGNGMKVGSERLCCCLCPCCMFVADVVRFRVPAPCPLSPAALPLSLRGALQSDYGGT